MAEVTRGTNVAITTLVPEPAHRQGGLFAGVAILRGQACYIHSDGTVRLSTGAAANAAAKVRGFVMVDAVAGDPVTLVHDVTIVYGTGLTPGADLFLSGTVPGGLADAASTGGTAPIGYVVDATRIRIWESRY